MQKTARMRIPSSIIHFFTVFLIYSAVMRYSISHVMYQRCRIFEICLFADSGVESAPDSYVESLDRKSACKNKNLFNCLQKTVCRTEVKL